MGFDTSVFLFTWVAPVFCGALIGYITNALAIKMLFRPFTKKVLFGIPVPLTPGIIPRHRSELAESMARMVARDLLSLETIQSRLDSVVFRHAVEEQCRKLRVSIFNQPLSKLFTTKEVEITENYQKVDLMWDELARDLLKKALKLALSSTAFVDSLRRLIVRLTNDIGELRLAQLVGIEELKFVIIKKTLPFLDHRDVRASLVSVARNWISRLVRGNEPFDRFLSTETRESIEEYYQHNLSILTDVVFEWLRSADVRDELEVQGQVVLRNIIDKLTTIQKVFVSASQYDRTLSERMPEIVTDIINQAEVACKNSALQEQIMTGVRHYLKEWQTRALADLIGSTKFQKNEIIEPVINAVVDAIIAESLAPIERSIDQWYSDNCEKTVSTLVAGYLGVQTVSIAEQLMKRLISCLSRLELADEIVALTRNWVSEIVKNRCSPDSKTRLADVLSIPACTAVKIDRFFSQRVILFLRNRMPIFIKTVDLESIITSKINDFDARSIEKLLLVVLSRHLKWVKFFGAVAGALVSLLLISVVASVSH